VRLSTTETFSPLLMGGLVPLRQEHPKIHVQLVMSNAALDLVRRDADVAIRLFREKNPTLVSLTLSVVAQTEAFLVIPPDHRNAVRVRLVMDAVTALFERERALLAGCV
jgi:DNA-binding transcriptional LysR family regulator